MQITRRFWSDTRGFIVSSETILLATVLVLGCVVGLSVLRDKFVTEYGDSAAALNRLNQSSSFTFTGTDVVDCCGNSVLSRLIGDWSVQAVVTNLAYVDETDFCEEVQAPVGDNPACIELGVAAIEENAGP